MPYLSTSSQYANTGGILQTMLCNEDQDESVLWPRCRKLPKLNTDEKNLQYMISWNRAYERLLTCNMSKEDTKELPMVVQYYCSHTQPIERELNGVTAASEAVYGREEEMVGLDQGDYAHFEY